MYLVGVAATLMPIVNTNGCAAGVPQGVLRGRYAHGAVRGREGVRREGQDQEGAHGQGGRHALLRAGVARHVQVWYDARLVGNHGWWRTSALLVDLSVMGGVVRGDRSKLFPLRHCRKGCCPLEVSAVPCGGIGIGIGGDLD